MEKEVWEQYFINIAHVVASRSDCLRRKVGAVIVVKNAIVSSGYNGAPMGMRNCDNNGCVRCSSSSSRGSDYDRCICVHAEQNAMLLAARHGISIDSGILFSTLRPCLSCIKQVIQAGIIELVYDEFYDYGEEIEDIYKDIVVQCKLTLRHING